MIKIINLNESSPYLIFKEKYIQALNTNQKNIEAISISSFNKANDEVDSRYVNLKYIDGDKFIFFSNYNSPKSVAFESHNQISALIYWSNVNVQIRMKAQIEKTSYKYNQKYFFEREEKKNALAISSNQSNVIDSYSQVKQNYDKSLKNDDLKKCPDYWGGFSFTPYYFEFWDGHESRINKRIAFQLNNDNWKSYFLEP